MSVQIQFSHLEAWFHNHLFPFSCWNIQLSRCVFRCLSSAQRDHFSWHRPFLRRKKWEHCGGLASLLVSGEKNLKIESRKRSAFSEPEKWGFAEKLHELERIKRLRRRLSIERCSFFHTNYQKKENLKEGNFLSTIWLLKIKATD